MEIVATHSTITKDNNKPTELEIVTLGLNPEEYHIIRQALYLATSKLQLGAFQSRLLIEMNKSIDTHQAFVQSKK